MNIDFFNLIALIVLIAVPFCSLTNNDLFSITKARLLSTSKSATPLFVINVYIESSS